MANWQMLCKKIKQRICCRSIGWFYHFLTEVVILGVGEESIPFPRTETDDTAGERGEGVDPAEISFDNQH